MAQTRKKMEGGVYEVETFTINSEPFFMGDATKRMIHRVFERATERFACKIIASTITNSGIYLLISTEPNRGVFGDISVIMQYIKTQITVGVNRALGRRGTIWQERFFSIMLAGSQEEFQQSVQQIHDHAKDQVSDLLNYEFSSFRVYKGTGKMKFISMMVWQKLYQEKRQLGIW